MSNSTMAIRLTMVPDLTMVLNTNHMANFTMVTNFPMVPYLIMVFNSIHVQLNHGHQPLHGL